MRLNEKTMQKASVVISLAVLANLLWGSAPAFIKTGYAMFQVGASDTAAQILFAGCRFFLAGIMGIILGIQILKMSDEEYNEKKGNISMGVPK